MKKLFQLHINTNRVYGLDILRCVAILCVVVEHSLGVLPHTVSTFLNFLVFDGVSIFFVLSGFLIGGIFIKEFERKSITPRTLVQFWQRRWYRTLPNYLLILIILTILNLLFTKYFTLSNVYSYFIFSQNLVTPHPGFFPEAWSLSIEEWFYLLIPVIILMMVSILGIKTRRSIIYTSVLVIVLVTAFRLYRYFEIPIHTYKEWDVHFRKQVFTRLDSLMYGVIGAYIAYHYKALWLKYKTPLLLIGLALLVIPKFLITNYGTLYFSVFSTSVNALATLFLLPYLNEVKAGRGSIYKTVTYISLISYSIYLINLSIVRRWIIGNIDLTDVNIYLAIIIKFALFWALTIVLSILLYKYFEIPTTRLRDKKKLNGANRTFAKAA